MIVHGVWLFMAPSSGSIGQKVQLKRYPTPISHLTEPVVPLQKSDNHSNAWVEAPWQAIK